MTTWSRRARPPDSHDADQGRANRICTALTLEPLSRVESLHGQRELACSLFGAAQSVWTNLGTTVEAFGRHLADESRREAEALRGRLSSTRVDEVIRHVAHITKPTRSSSRSARTQRIPRPPRRTR